jgi:hypothetical protein
MRDGAGSFLLGRFGAAPTPSLPRAVWGAAGAVMRQPSRYSKADLGRSAPPPTHRAGGVAARRATGRGGLEEIIVVAAFARYIGQCESAVRARRPAALRRTPALSASSLPPRRVAAPGDAYRMNPQPSVFADATPMNESRDAMISNTPGFLPNSFLPHSTASPAAVTAAAAARLGVPPEWQSACLSTPPTPKKLGWW